jgi:hypothetical protein
MVVADMDLMIDDIDHFDFGIKILKLRYWEEISDSFIVSIPEQCNEEQFGHFGVRIGR